MKKAILSLFVAMLSYTFSYAQTFYVQPSEKKFATKIIEKMKYEGYKLTDQKESSDFTVDCLVSGQYNFWKIGNMFHGYVKVSDTKTGNEITRTKEVGKSPTWYNGLQAGPKIMAVIADKYLDKELTKVTSNFKSSGK